MNNSVLTRRMMLMTVTGLAAVPVALTQAPRGGGRGRPGGTGGNQLEEMKKRLNLTADQEEKIKAIYDDQMKQMQEMRENADPDSDRSAMRDKMMKIREETNTKIMDVLDDDQKKEYEKMQEKMQQNRSNRTSGEGGRRPQQ